MHTHIARVVLQNTNKSRHACVSKLKNRDCSIYSPERAGRSRNLCRDRLRANRLLNAFASSLSVEWKTSEFKHGVRSASASFSARSFLSRFFSRRKSNACEKVEENRRARFCKTDFWCFDVGKEQTHQIVRRSVILRMEEPRISRT